jgi:hypothetical protein
MKFMASANALFIGLRDSESYHQALQVPSVKRDKLMEARRLIRQQIRDAATRIRIEDRFWDASSAAHRTHKMRPDIAPKFFTQGSVAYDLLIDPAHKTTQQLDLDDGMYVGVDYLQNGQPALVAKALFALVEEVLAPLCVQHGWELDTTKETCVRINLDKECHIDIPIYSAPRDRMIAMDAIAAQTRADSVVLKRAGHEYVRLPPDKIMLAHRGGNWDQSDPLALHDWVNDCAARYGELFRRGCRYIKGWRDHRWPSGCLTSIAIMAAMVEALEDMNGTHRNLDDDRLVYEISNRLPRIFEGDLLNPAFPNEEKVLNNWSTIERREVVRAAEALREAMHDALVGTAVADLVITALRKTFGNRIPNRPDAVKIIPRVAATVMAAAAVTVPAPRVIASTSG